MTIGADSFTAGAPPARQETTNTGINVGARFGIHCFLVDAVSLDRAQLLARLGFASHVRLDDDATYEKVDANYGELVITLNLAISAWID